VDVLYTLGLEEYEKSTRRSRAAAWRVFWNTRNSQRVASWDAWCADISSNGAVRTTR
jgi:hypothetical protein